MYDVLRFDMRLKGIKQKTTDTLLIADVFNENVFNELYSYLSAVAENPRGQSVVWKQFLAVVLDARALFVRSACQGTVARWGQDQSRSTKRLFRDS